LTLVRAPAGFGKTTLMAQWATTTPERVVWMRARPGTDSRRFWTDALQALADSGVPVHADTSPADHSDLAYRMERTLLEAGRPVVVVVDSFEEITDPDLDRVLLDMLRHTPDMRLVVGLRSHRHFSTERHLDLGPVVLSARDLRFTTDETAQLLAAAGAVVSPLVVEPLVEATGGWPEPTRSLALRLREAESSSGLDVRALAEGVTADYLHARLLPDERHESLVDFALRTSVADEFTEETAELLGDDPAARTHLHALEGEGMLLVTTRERRNHYRWPSAARTALRHELERRDPQLSRELHSRLGRWHYGRGELSLALRHAITCCDWALVIEVIESSWRQLLVEHNNELVEAFMTLPMEVVERSPRVLAVRDTKLPVPDERLIRAATLPRSPKELAEIGRRADAHETLDTCLAVLIALRNRGELALAREYGLRSLHIASSARSVHPGSTRDLYAALHLQVGITQILAGDTSGAVPTLQEAHHKGAQHTMGYVQSDAAAKLALAHCLLGENDHAETWMSLHRQAPLRAEPLGRSAWLLPTIHNTATTAELLLALDELDLAKAGRANARLARFAGREELWPLVIHARAQYALYAGTADEMLRLIDRARITHQSRMGRGSIARPLLAAVEADLQLSLGRANLAQAALSAHDNAHPLTRVVRARLELLAGRTEQALQLTYDAEWERAAGQQDVLAMQLIRTVAAHRTGDLEVAAGTLERTVRVAAATGIWRPFLTVPRPELDEVLDRAPASRAVLDDSPIRDGRSIFPDAVTIIELTEREQKVLVELANGRSLPQIATDFVLSDNTVRSQRRTLYRKLGTSDRATAVARAREWGLLPGTS
jgi:LuxR family maltose regulon positive regulatory protein